MSLPANIIEWNDSSEAFLSAVKEFKGLVILDFISPYCGRCKASFANIPLLAAEYPEVRFYKCNVEEAEDISCEYKITTIPYLKFFKVNDAGEAINIDLLHHANNRTA